MTKTNSVVINFLSDLKLMLVETGTSYPAPWNQVPEKYRKDFKDWAATYKQESWDGMWEKGWYNYHLEYINYLINELVDKLEGGGAGIKSCLRK